MFFAYNYPYDCLRAPEKIIHVDQRWQCTCYAVRSRTKSNDDCAITCTVIFTAAYCIQVNFFQESVGNGTWMTGCKIVNMISRFQKCFCCVIRCEISTVEVLLSLSNLYWRFAHVWPIITPACDSMAFKVAKTHLTEYYFFLADKMKNYVEWVIPLYEQVIFCAWTFVSPWFCVNMQSWTNSQWISSVKFRYLITATSVKLCSVIFLPRPVLLTTRQVHSQYGLVIFIVGAFGFQILFHFNFSFCMWVN